VRLAAVLLCALGLLLAEDREGNFQLRFEPTAKLQTNIDVPFEIHVLDGLKKPLPNAKVELSIILTVDESHLTTFKAPAIGREGVYLAKPVFPVPGQWDVAVTVRRGDQVTTRTIQFNVTE
jgi:nitrogen fixation protein FixH